MRSSFAVVLISALSTPAIAQGVPGWGLLANPGFDQAPVKGAYFFAGNWRNGSQWYEYPLGSNIDLYTVFPQDPKHLGWSESQANRDFAVDAMVNTGFNVVLMSYWGVRGSSYWAVSAPMQTSTYAHDELFSTALGRNILIMPAIENSGVDRSGVKGFTMGDALPDFGTPGTPGNYSNTLIGQVEDLVNRYLFCPANPGAKQCSTNPGTNPNWPTKWATMYDRKGVKRYAINLFSACSNTLDSRDSGRDQKFAAALASLANQVYVDTGFRVGFTIDAQWANTAGCTGYLPTAATVGPWLAQTDAVLAISPFREEAWASDNSEATRINSKRAFIDQWVSTGIPVILDVTAGYDAHGLGNFITYGNDDTWRNYQSQVKGNGVKGIAFDVWNGYTEGWAGMPSCGGSWEPACGVGSSDTMSRWLSGLLSNDPRDCQSYQFVNGLPTYNVYGDICRKWYLTGGSTGALGDAASSEHDALVAGARVTEFAMGRVYWTPQNGSKEVHGLIFQDYALTGYETGPLGLPTSDEEDAHSEGARLSEFTYGDILWSGPTGAHSVHGLIDLTYRQMLRDGSWLGLPISDEEASTTYCSNGRRNRFQNGFIDWCPGWSSGYAHP
jgi:hypothetical protein